MTKYYVVAGTRQEFEEFMHRKAGEMWQGGEDVSFSHFVYVESAGKLIGVENPHGWFYGTWRQRKDIHILIETLLHRSAYNNPMIRNIQMSLRHT